MDPSTLAIPIGFILLAGVLCLLLIDSRWGWKQKLALIVIVPAFGLGVWASISSYKGWPTTADPPKKVLVFWTLVREPHPERNDKGAIFIWALPYEGGEARSLNPLDYSSPGGEPRAYKLQYSRSLHIGLERAKPGMGKGNPMVLEMGAETPSSNGSDDQGPDGGRPSRPGGGGGYGSDVPEREFHLYQLPPTQSPAKDPER